MHEKIGHRRHYATFSEHDGSQDAAGNPLYSDPTKWSDIVASWPCEFLTARGGEVLRGRQVSANTTHVLFGEYFGAGGVRADMRVQITGQTYSVVSAFDPDGLSREMRVECKKEPV